MRISDWSSERVLFRSLREVYGDDTYDGDIKDLDDDSVVELAGNLRRGVPIASPVFDGATEAEIDRHLEMAGLRSEERRAGKECVSTCRSRWSPYHSKKKN